MKKLILIAVILVGSLTGFAQKGKWEKALRKNNIQDYKEFLEKYPESEFSNDALLKLTELEFQRAKFIDTAASYKYFLEKYGDNAYSEKAAYNLIKIEFEESHKNYSFLLKNYGNNAYAKKAIEDLCQVAIKNARKNNTIEAYQKFISDFSTSEYVSEAKKAIDLLSWNKVQKDNTFNAYLDFIQECPESIFKISAQSWIDSILVSSVPISNSEIESISTEISYRISPFKLDDLFDELMSTSQKLNNKNQILGQQSRYEAGVNINIFQTETGSIIQKTKEKKQNGTIISVTLQSLPENNIVDVFYEKDGKSSKQLRIKNPKSNKTGGIIFSEVILPNYKDPGKEDHYIYIKDKCYDYNTLK